MKRMIFQVANLFVVALAVALLTSGCGGRATKGRISQVRLSYEEGTVGQSPRGGDPVLGAVVGGAVAGTTGAIIGAAVGNDHPPLNNPPMRGRLIACSFVVTLSDGRQGVIRLSRQLEGYNDALFEASTFRDGDLVTVYTPRREIHWHNQIAE